MIVASVASSARVSRRFTSSSTLRAVSEKKKRFEAVLVIDEQLSQSSASDLYEPV